MASGPKPNLALEINGKLAAAHFDEDGMMRIRQLGVNHVIMGGPKIPWETSEIPRTSIVSKVPDWRSEI